MAGKTPNPSWQAWASKVTAGRLILLAIVLWIAVCAVHEPGRFAPQGPVPDFAGLKGHIRVSLGAEKDRTYTIGDGALVDGGRPADPPETATAYIWGGAEGLTPPEGRVFDGPYLASPNGRYLAAAVQLPDTVASGQSKRYAFVVLDQETGRFTVETEPSAWKVIGVAWSPDSERLAVLRKLSKIGFCPFDILVRVAGHANFYTTWVIEMVDLEAGSSAPSSSRRTCRAPSDGLVGTVEDGSARADADGILSCFALDMARRMAVRRSTPDLLDVACRHTVATTACERTYIETPRHVASRPTQESRAPTAYGTAPPLPRSHPPCQKRVRRDLRTCALGGHRSVGGSFAGCGNKGLREYVLSRCYGGGTTALSRGFSTGRSGRKWG